MRRTVLGPTDAGYGLSRRRLYQGGSGRGGRDQAPSTDVLGRLGGRLSHVGEGASRAQAGCSGRALQREDGGGRLEHACCRTDVLELLFYIGRRIGSSGSRAGPGSQTLSLDCRICAGGTHPRIRRETEKRLGQTLEVTPQAHEWEDRPLPVTLSLLAPYRAARL